MKQKIKLIKCPVCTTWFQIDRKQVESLHKHKPKGWLVNLCCSSKCSAVFRSREVESGKPVITFDEE